jgi:methionyl-tRNA formyltransferase
MRIGFAGTPAFAATALEAILAAEFSVDLVLSQPDRPRGRGMRLEPGPVKAIAIRHSLDVRQPATLKPEREWGPIVAMKLDVLVVAAYGLLVPAPMLAWPRHGCINIHASLLPRWRGAAPVERALLAGDPETGISIMRMDEGLDTGPVISRYRLPIEPRETAGALRARLAMLGASAIVETLARLDRGEPIDAQAQDPSAASYAAKIDRGEAIIDWRADAATIDRIVRAFDPVPGAQTSTDGATLKIWKAIPLAGRFGTPGSIVQADGSALIVACGNGALSVSELQRAGGKRMPVRAFLAGHRLPVGTRLGSKNG